MANQNITPEVEQVIRASTITNNVLFLPQQLDRKLYQNVNKVLTNAGGKWNRSAKGHVFPSDPMAKLGLALETGKSIDEQQLFQAFYTPPHLAARMADLADVAGKTVLEPSAGMGALADACKKRRARLVLCNDINPECVHVLEGKGYQTFCTDFLTSVSTQKFDRVVMNPPFTRGSDLKHLARALHHVTANGIIVCLVAGSRTDEELEAIALNNTPGMNVYTEDVPEKTFKDTPIKTKIVRLSN